MTEADWQDSTSVYDMLRALRARKSPWRWTTRKERLFACACCRRAWHVLTEPAQRQAVEMAERTAEKEIRLYELAAAQKAAKCIHLGVDKSEVGRGYGSRMSKGWDFFVECSPQGEMFCNPGGLAAAPIPWGNAYGTANDVRALLHFRAGADLARQEQRVQCALLRDLAGPVQPHPVLDRAWLLHDGGAAPKLARSIYAERAFDRLPILADALEEAGCDQAPVLAHCRSGGEHARGCWAVDWVLGKE